MVSRKKLASVIDLSAFGPHVSAEEVKGKCVKAKKLGFAAVVVKPSHVKIAAKALKGSKTKPCAVIGFPFGADSPSKKLAEARQAFRDGAKELDVMMNVRLFKRGFTDFVKKEIAAIVKVAKKKRVVVKVIIESNLLTIAQKISAAKLVKAAGADYIKTGTGLFEGVEPNDVRLIRRIVGKKVGVKASGGVRSLGQVFSLLRAGANRIGTSYGLILFEEEKPEREEKAGSAERVERKGFEKKRALDELVETLRA